ncbi:MAG: hypothetical protein IMZ71_02265, partial [Chloroflexi bacterium]|nr:hypothetical protein [Chloroflexota bacterium]
YTWNDTWSYDYTRNTWTNLTPSNPPSVRIGHAMTYEAFSGKVILFGGSMWGPDDSCFNDTWALSMPILLPASSNPSFPMR